MKTFGFVVSLTIFTATVDATLVELLSNFLVDLLCEFFAKSVPLFYLS